MSRQQNPIVSASAAVSRRTRRTPRNERRGSRGQQVQVAVRSSIHAHQ
jgi:hypothetical protein